MLPFLRLSFGARCCSFPGVFDFKNENECNRVGQWNVSFDSAKYVNVEIVFYSPGFGRFINIFRK